MTVLRIVPNIEVADPARAQAFYGGILGLDLLMDQGWIVTHGAAAQARPQISFMSQGGSGTAVPAISVEVDDPETVLARARAAGPEPDYGPVEEPWGVTRFYLRDPFGNLVNILSHT